MTLLAHPEQVVAAEDMVKLIKYFRYNLPLCEADDTHVIEEFYFSTWQLEVMLNALLSSPLTLQKLQEKQAGILAKGVKVRYNGPWSEVVAFATGILGNPFTQPTQNALRPFWKEVQGYPRQTLLMSEKGCLPNQVEKLRLKEVHEGKRLP